jgi:hypothetical protein
MFPWLWEATNILLLLALALVCYSVAWEENTRVYLKGFSDAVVPVPASAMDKDREHPGVDEQRPAPPGRGLNRSEPS